MPFDYQKFDAQCATLPTEELLKVHKHYTKLSAGAMTGTAVSALSIPLTLGLSGLAIGMSAGAHHNAKKKKLIVEKYLKARGIEADQATQYANAMAANEQDKNRMWMEQQAWQNANAAGPSSSSSRSPPPADYKYNHPNSGSEKGSMKKKGDMPTRSEPSPPPPPPTYDEALSRPAGAGPSSSSSGYVSPPPPQEVFGAPSQQGWRQQQGAYAQSPGGYGSPPPPQQGYAYGYPPGGPGYCAPQAGLYPQSAMYHQRPGEDPRHVHFAQ